MATFTDNLNGTAGDLLSARSGWVRTGSTDNCTLADTGTGFCQAQGTGGSGTWHSPTSQPTSNDQYVEMILGTWGNNAYHMGVRCDTSAAGGDGYVLRRDGVTRTRLYKRISGTFTLLGTYNTASGSVYDTDKVRLEVSGTSLTVYVGATLAIGPVTDSAIASGSVSTLSRAGTITTTTPNFDDIGWGDLGAAGVTGTLAATETGADTFAGAGSVAITGTVAAQESGADTFAGAGEVTVAGTMAATETGSDTFTGTGTVGGAPSSSGTMAAAETGSDSFSGAGSVTVSGALAAAESGADSFSGAGGVTVAGTLAAAEAGSDTFAATGTVGAAPSSTGSMAAQESGSDVLAASGTVRVSGSMAAQETGADTFTASGTVGGTGFITPELLQTGRVRAREQIPAVRARGQLVLVRQP